MTFVFLTDEFDLDALKISSIYTLADRGFVQMDKAKPRNKETLGAFAECSKNSIMDFN